MTAPILCSVCASPVTFWANPCGDWTYNRCESCGHVDLEGQPELKELERYYSEVYQNSAESFAWAVEHRYVSAVERAAARIGISKRRLLEVGCNSGQLLVAMRKRGWDVAGTELGTRFRATARSQGLDVRMGLEDWVHERFSMIVSFHVLEHVSDARSELRKMRDRLDPGGALILKTPNVDCLFARVFPAEWEWTSPPAHLRLYSASSLVRQLTGVGFEVIGIKSAPGNSRPLPFLVARALGLRLRGSDRRYTPGLDPRHRPVSGRGWYKALERLGRGISFIGLPIQPLLNGLMLAPELEAIARRP